MAREAMTPRGLVEEVAARAGFPDAEGAERATRAVLGVIAERLSRSECEALAEALPAGFVEPLRRAELDAGFEVDDLYACVAREERVTIGFAKEHAVSVCQVVAEALSDEALGRLERALPRSIATLFERGSTASDLPPRATSRGGTLAEGRPGSSHPISEARPERAHGESVARAENPHGDTKLSSSRGLTQEREGESLATGRPGSSHPLTGDEGG
jgi:uncharacterized protein (DUF2267 family)